MHVSATTTLDCNSYILEESPGPLRTGLLFIVMMCPPWQAVVPHMHFRLFWRPVQPALPDAYSLAVSKTKRAEPAADADYGGGSNVHVVFDDVTVIFRFPFFHQATSQN